MAGSAENGQHQVGGVVMPRPFKVRRLGHFGLNVADMAAARRFYVNLLGLQVSDPLDFGARLPPEKRAGLGDGVGLFLRHNTEHHTFVIFPRPVLQALRRNPHEAADNTINQITWQLGSLREVVDGADWLRARGTGVLRAGRDTPGSNWHVYPFDPDGHINELFYGIEQVGWDGRSKPLALHSIRYEAPPPLPHRSEMAEVAEARARGVDLAAGTCAEEPEAERFDVGGVLLARPFKITRIGPVRLFVEDVEAALAFYRDVLGLALTETVTWRGHRCHFLRAGTEHHSLALYPKPLRAELGLSPHTSLFSFGFQLAEYSQLRDGLRYLADREVRIRHLPAELFPGIDYTAFAFDPEGHAIQLYFDMEQIGWDGRPRPAALRPKVDPQAWPAMVEARPDTYAGEPFLGPWN